MAESKRKNDKIACPETHYLSPNDIVKDHTLSHEEKKCALSTWEQDARQLLIASNEVCQEAKKALIRTIAIG